MNELETHRALHPGERLRDRPTRPRDRVGARTPDADRHGQRPDLPGAARLLRSPDTTATDTTSTAPTAARPRRRSRCQTQSRQRAPRGLEDGSEAPAAAATPARGRWGRRPAPGPGPGVYFLFLSGGEEEDLGPVQRCSGSAAADGTGQGRQGRQGHKGGPTTVPAEVDDDFAVGRDPFAPLPAEEVIVEEPAATDDTDHGHHHGRHRDRHRRRPGTTPGTGTPTAAPTPTPDRRTQ